MKVVTIGLNLFFLESTFKVHHKNTKNVGGFYARLWTTGLSLIPLNTKWRKTVGSQKRSKRPVTVTHKMS